MTQAEEVKEKVKNLTEEFIERLSETGEFNNYTFHLRLTPKYPDGTVGFYTDIIEKRRNKPLFMFYDSEGSEFDYLTTLKLSCK